MYGASDRNGAEPAENPVTPGKLAATIFHLIGINPGGLFSDAQGRPLAVSDEEPLFELLGSQPATQLRVRCTGDPERVPAFNPDKLVATDFAEPTTLQPASSPTRPKGWCAAPLIDTDEDRFGVRLEKPITPQTGHTVVLGFGLAGGKGRPRIPRKSAAILAQRIASPTAGRYIARLQAQGTGADPRYYEQVFLRHFRARLTLFQFLNRSKTPLERRELASIDVRPSFQAAGSFDFETFELDKLLANAEFGMNFSFGLGIGVAVILERETDRELPAVQHAGQHQAMIRIKSITLEFQPKIV